MSDECEKGPKTAKPAKQTRVDVWELLTSGKRKTMLTKHGRVWIVLFRVVGGSVGIMKKPKKKTTTIEVDLNILFRFEVKNV